MINTNPKLKEKFKPPGIPLLETLATNVETRTEIPVQKLL
jgi:hypothetical protein